MGTGTVPSAAESAASEWKSQVVLVGDSTVTDESGWGTGFAACIVDDVKCTNQALGGRSSSSYREEGHWDDVLALKPD
jgi:pectinesterase